MNTAERFALVRTIASGFAHEIRNPLAGISASLQVLQGQKEDPYQSKIVSQVLDETEKLDQFLKLLLRLSHRQLSNPQTFLLSGLIEQLKSQCEPLLSSGNIQLSVQLNPLDMKIYGSAPLLEEALLCLLKNAIEAMPQGGDVCLRAFFAEGTVNIEIVDQGVGMSSEQLEQAFDPFYTTKAEHKGLGLFWAQKNIEEHGGSVQLSPRDSGSGLRCLCVLPCEA